MKIHKIVAQWQGKTYIGFKTTCLVNAIMKLPSVAQMRAWDAYTMKVGGMSSLDLMHQAASECAAWIASFYPAKKHISVFAGTGNNGGDGWSIGLQLRDFGFQVTVYDCLLSNNRTPGNAHMRSKYVHAGGQIVAVSPGDPLPGWSTDCLVVDALLGYGLTRPITGYWSELVEKINTSGCHIIAIDIPSGLQIVSPTKTPGIQADDTLALHTLKLPLLLPENGRFVGRVHVLDIGLAKDFDFETDFEWLSPAKLRSCLKTRHRHDHKGVYGHALLVMGGYGMTGAAVLSGRACLRAGVGRLTVHAPKCAYDVLQTAVPEAMFEADEHQYHICNVPADVHKYQAIGMGCGMGQQPSSIQALAGLLQLPSLHLGPPRLVLDADALNILGTYPQLQALLPPHTILTPHPKEFERLFGSTGDSFEQLALLQHQAMKLQAVVVLKGGITKIATPDGRVYFHTGGNPGMATAGSGDVLTGIIVGLLAQGYRPVEAAQLGVVLHGMAGDQAAFAHGQEAMVASDIVQALGKAFITLRHDVKPS